MTATQAQDTDRAPYRPRDLRLLDVWDAVGSRAVSVLSTDVFDTLVWRQVPEPVDAFPLIAQRLRARGQLCPDLTDVAYARLREAAERRAREERRGDTEVKLHEIYRSLPPWVFGDAIDWYSAAEVELEVERDLLVPDLDMVELLEAAQHEGKRVIAISDTYLSEGELRSLLAQPVLAGVHFDLVLTSSDHRTNKSGGLFEVALAQLGVKPKHVVHVGDNRKADVDAPRRLGVRTFVFERRPRPLPEVVRREEHFLPRRSENEREAIVVSGLAAVRAKALSRAELADLPQPLQPFWEYGASVLGPVFTGFAEWVHEHCRRTATQRVLCLMREGSLLSTLLTRANAYLGAELEARPLWLNRDLCRRATIGTVSEEHLGALISGVSTRTVAEFCRLLGAELSELPRFASRAECSLTDPELRLELVDHLGQEPEIRARILARAQALRERIGHYLARETGTPDAPVTLVDLGWAASSQGALQEVLERLGAPRHTVGLYLLTRDVATRQVFRGAEVHGFVGDFGFPESPVKTILRSPEVLEQICMPPHGTQLDLDETLEPVLAPNGLPQQQIVEAEATRKGILAFQREWARYQTALPGKIGSLAGVQRLLRPILLRAVAAPTAAEVGLYGGWQHDEGAGSARMKTVADASNLPRLRHMTPNQTVKLPMSELYWPFGLAGQIDEHWSDLMQAAASEQIPWEALGSPLETGSFSMEASGGDDRPARAVTIPARNRLGLSLVYARLRASRINRVTLRPAAQPCVLRIDWIELRCWAHGRPDPTLVRFDEANSLDGLRLNDCFKLDPNALFIHGPSASVVFDPAQAVQDDVFGIDVECAFAALPLRSVVADLSRWRELERVERISGPRAVEERRAPARFRDLEQAERHIRELEGSLSWRITAPLRAAKRGLS